MRQHERFYFPQGERDWHGQEESPTAIFGFRIAKWIGIAGHGEQRPAGLVDLIGRLSMANGGNPLYEYVVDLRLVVWPGGARERARDRVCWYLLVRVSVHGGTREALEQAATERQADVVAMLDHFLPEYLFATLSTSELREALEPFPVGDLVSLRRGGERWCGGEIPEEFPGTLDGERLANELLKYEGPSALSFRFRPVGVSEEDIWAAQQQVFASATQGGNTCAGCRGSVCMRQIELMQLDVVSRMDGLRGGAFAIDIDLARAEGIRHPLIRMLEREAGDLASGCTCMRPRNCLARGARVSEFALAMNNLARLRLVRWDDLAGKRLEDDVAALMELASVHEVARLWPLPGGMCR